MNQPGRTQDRPSREPDLAVCPAAATPNAAPRPIPSANRTVLAVAGFSASPNGDPPSLMLWGEEDRPCVASR